jgi:hypothetical protein
LPPNVEKSAAKAESNRAGKKAARALVGLEITRPGMIMGSKSDGKHRWLVIRQQNVPWGIGFQHLHRSGDFFVQ